jgi:hypothetical protein
MGEESPPEQQARKVVHLVRNTAVPESTAMLDQATRDLWCAMRASLNLIRRARERAGLPELKL